MSQDHRQFSFPDTGSRVIFGIAAAARTANLALMVNLLRPNSGDRYVWLQSQTATRGKWQAGIDQVLRNRGIKSLSPVIFSDSPLEAFAEVEGALRARKEEVAAFDYIGVILNGGNKTMPVQIDSALNAVFDQRETLAFYSGPENCTATAWSGLWRDGGALPLTNAVTLDELLACNSYKRVVKNGTTGLKIWPGDVGIPLLDRNYADDFGYAKQLHEQNDFYVKTYESVEIPSFEGFDANSDIRNNLNRVVGAICDEVVKKRIDDITKVKSEAKEELVTALCGAQLDLPDDSLKRILNVIRKDLRSARNALNAQVQAAVVDGVKERFGLVFEAAVAQRVQKWFKLHGAKYAVSEVWCGAPIDSINENEGETEIDIAIVLNNATIINIECKADGNEDKLRADIDRKRLKENRYSAIGSKLFVTMPIYTDCCDRPWLQRILKLRSGITSRSVQLLDFTQPEGHAPSFICNTGTGETYRTFEGATAPHERPIPTFEDGLASILAPYRKAALPAVQIADAAAALRARFSG